VPTRESGLDGKQAPRAFAHDEQLRQTHAASIWLDRAGLFARGRHDESEREQPADGDTGEAAHAAECAPAAPLGGTDADLALWLSRADDARWLASASADELRAAVTSLARSHGYERRRHRADGERVGAASGPAKMRLALEVLRSELEHARKTVRALKVRSARAHASPAARNATRCTPMSTALTTVRVDSRHGHARRRRSASTLRR
jgi:hypothetical protein